MLENQWDIGSELGSGLPPESIICPLDGAEMVLVPEGSFLMGITEEELRQIFVLDPGGILYRQISCDQLSVWKIR
jgi:hypothetical protein